MIQINAGKCKVMHKKKKIELLLRIAMFYINSFS